MPNFLKQTIIFTSLLFTLAFSSCWQGTNYRKGFTAVRTLVGPKSEIGEPFGIAERNGDVYVSDGEKGVIWRISKDGAKSVFAGGLDTPSQIAFDKNGELLVADSGDHTIKSVAENGEVRLVAGSSGKPGYRDGGGVEALFNAPIGVAVSEDKIFVADTYNDRVRVIENGQVTTIAGNSQGFQDSANGIEAQFDTPTGLAGWKDGRLLIADTGNRRIRVLEIDGGVWTLAGSGRQILNDGLLNEAEFVQPTALAVGENGAVYVADGNAIRVIGRRLVPLVETISSERHGFRDDKLNLAQFNRPSGLVFDKKGNLLVADSDNRLVRAFTARDIGRKVSKEDFKTAQTRAEEFRKLSEPRWTYDPPDRTREIAGTLGEIRGEIADENSEAWFHNGLDIVGGYGETARFIRDEKVLRPIAVQNFDTTRELIRMPTLGYIHIRLGRDVASKPFNDKRFQFSLDAEGKPDSLRIPRGSKFEAGEAIGTLNTLNHVHLIAGRAGHEMNALDALILPGVSDKRLPEIKDIELYEEDWEEFETASPAQRIKLNGKTRIVVEAYDQMDGNAARRKLGIYKLGYQLFDSEENSVKGFEKPRWTIRFDKTPDSRAVKLVYAKGSKSGATGETIFRYIVTNEVSGGLWRENFFDAGRIEKGVYVLRVFASDFFGNTASKDFEFETDGQRKGE